MAFDLFDPLDDLAGPSVCDARFVVVTAGGSDHPLFEALVPVLLRVRSGLDLDVAFLSQFTDNAPVVQDRAGTHAADACDPSEVEYGNHLLDATQAGRDRTGMKRTRRFFAPVISEDGRRHGTVFCAKRPQQGSDQATEEVLLTSVARRLALALSRRDEPNPEDGSPSNLHLPPCSDVVAQQAHASGDRVRRPAYCLDGA